MPRRFSTYALLCSAILSVVPALPAQVRAPGRPPNPAVKTETPAAPVSVSELIKVTIYPSRNEVVPNGSYGVYADLENISAYPVMIFPNQTALVVLPEAAEPSACVDWEPGIFPTEHTGHPARPTAANNRSALWDDPLVIQRGEHYVVFWDLEPATAKSAAYNGNCQLPPRGIAALGFVPGDYAFTVEGNAYAQSAPAPPTTPAVGSTPTDASASPSPSGANVQLADLLSKASTGALPVHHFSETKTLHVGLSQLTTLLAAMIGAFIAYWVIALRPGKDWDAFIMVIAPGSVDGSTRTPSATRSFLAFLALARNAALAAILGGVVTIVASRLSDTHFPVKVSVNDWWGALTIGFVAYFIGNKFVDSLANLGNSTVGSTIGKPPAAPVVPVAGTPVVPVAASPAIPGAVVTAASASPPRTAETGSKYPLPSAHFDLTPDEQPNDLSS